MAQKRKQRVREKGKISLSRYFQKLEKGQKVAIKPNATLPVSVPKRFQGKIGIVDERRGRAYVIKIKDGNLPKKLILRPIHLLKVV